MWTSCGNSSLSSTSSWVVYSKACHQEQTPKRRMLQWDWIMSFRYIHHFGFDSEHNWESLHISSRERDLHYNFSFFVKTPILKLEMPTSVISDCSLDEINSKPLYWWSYTLVSAHCHRFGLRHESKLQSHLCRLMSTDRIHLNFHSSIDRIQSTRMLQPVIQELRTQWDSKLREQISNVFGLCKSSKNVPAMPLFCFF